jgi:hypothetical protein
VSHTVSIDGGGVGGVGERRAVALGTWELSAPRGAIVNLDLRYEGGGGRGGERERE